MSNNITKYISEDIVSLKKGIRKELLDDDYKQLLTNIFIDNCDHIIIFKSFVRRTNPNEWKFLTITQKIYNQIKDKYITIILIERNDNLSIFHKMYTMKVESLTPTNSIRNKKYNYKRYIINESSIEENINSEIYEGFGLAS